MRQRSININSERKTYHKLYYNIRKSETMGYEMIEKLNIEELKNYFENSWFKSNRKEEGISCESF